MERMRRSVLSTVTTTAVGLTAGCLKEAEFDNTDGGYAAFFTLADWGNAVAGKALTFETPVAVGDQGHGFSTSSDLITDLGTSSVFVYLDSPDFPWAQDAASVLERDYGDVIVVDAMAGIDRLEWDHEPNATDDNHDGHDEHADHEHGRFDPHVWLDPVRATSIVQTIASGVTDAVPRVEETVDANATAYVERLDELDEQFRDRVFDAGDLVGVLASHDSFRYLQDRYGFELHTPTGVSPDQSPSQSAITETIEFVNAHGIDTVLYDAFESDRLARSIVENSAAMDVEAVTPAAGTTAAWNERGWGYIEQLQHVTVPAFEEALVSRD